ncbi:transposase [Rhodococcus sp. TAF43]|uniref:transposase n=1 Tax=Rhodococcus sp. TAF43 TaxID=3237483 RepID=UPI003F9B7B08
MNYRTAQDWDNGVRRSSQSRVYPDGRRVDYTTGVTTTVDVSEHVPVAVLEKPLHPRFLTLAERERIQDLRAEGASLRAIGRDLGRPASTLMREIAANSASDGSYRPYGAQRASARRRPRPKPRRLLEDGPLRNFVVEGLGKRWSPQQICNALKKEHPDDEQMRVSVETIYQALYVQARGGLKQQVAAALRTGRIRRKPASAPTSVEGLGRPGRGRGRAGRRCRPGGPVARGSRRATQPCPRRRSEGTQKRHHPRGHRWSLASTDLQLDARVARYHGLDTGYGRITGIDLDVQATARGRRPRRSTITLAGRGGRVEVEPVPRRDDLCGTASRPMTPG